MDRMMNIDEEMEKVIKKCERYGFNYHESINGIFIRTVSIAGWFILLTDKPRLFHENYRHRNKYGNGVMEGYHEHTNIRETTAEGMVDYIVAHDKLQMRTKKQVVDKLEKVC